MSKRTWSDAHDDDRNNASLNEESLLDLQLQDPNPKRASFGSGGSPYGNGVNMRRESILNGHARPSSPGNLTAEAENPHKHAQQDAPRPMSANLSRNKKAVPLAITRKVKACAACRKQKVQYNSRSSIVFSDPS